MTGDHASAVLTGRVVTLAPLLAEHAEITLHWRQSTRARYLNRGATTVDGQREWILASAARGDRNYIILMGDAPVGMIALHDMSRAHRNIVMGRFLIGEVERVGSLPVAYETEKLLCDFVFDTLGMHKIYGDVLESNEAMLRWRRYLGYTREGLMRDHYLFEGTFVNTVMVSLLEDEYRLRCRGRLENLILAGLQAVEAGSTSTADAV